MGFFGGGGAAVNLASPSAIGNTTPNTGKFTTLEATTSLQISTSGFLFGGTNLLEQRNSTSAQTFQIYNTFTDASNYERGFIRWNSNILEIGQEKAGTGSDRNVRLITRTVNNHVALGSSSAIGFGINGDSTPAIIVNSVERMSMSASSLALQNDANVGISFSAGYAFQNDLVIRRDGAANTLAQRNLTNAQEFRLYGTYTSTTNYQRMTVKSVKQTLSALSGASQTTTGTFIPDGAVVVGVTTRVATLLAGATGYTIGDGTDADRWGDITGTAVGTTSDNRDWTAGTIECFTAGGNITLTAKTSNFTAGAIEICVFYLAGEAD